MVDDILLMKYMQGLCTEKEKEEISRWIEESEENGKAFRDAHRIYDSILMSVDPSTLAVPDMVRRRKTGKTFRIAAAFLSAAAVTAVAVLLSIHFSRLSLSHETIMAEVPAGKMMTLTLGDGTRVDLNSGARLEYLAVFYGKHRKQLHTPSGSDSVPGPWRIQGGGQTRPAGIILVRGTCQYSRDSIRRTDETFRESLRCGYRH